MTCRQAAFTMLHEPCQPFAGVRGAKFRDFRHLWVVLDRTTGGRDVM
jgi:hypothetical protein